VPFDDPPGMKTILVGLRSAIDRAVSSALCRM
jgi:hypothetical protein